MSKYIEEFYVTWERELFSGLRLVAEMARRDRDRHRKAVAGIKKRVNALTKAKKLDAVMWNYGIDQVWHNGEICAMKLSDPRRPLVRIMDVHDALVDEYDDIQYYIKEYQLPDVRGRARAAQYLERKLAELKAKPHG